MPTKIMLVEDEQPIREMLRYALEKQDFQVIEAESAKHAREILMTQRPDLLVVDWMMPDESGVEFVRRFKQDEIWSEIPVMILTARVEEMDKVRGLENGADDGSACLRVSDNGEGIAPEHLSRLSCRLTLRKL